MVLRVLVAKMDGMVGRDGVAFLPGSIPEEFVTVTVHGRAVGFASLEVEGDDVFACIQVSVPSDQLVGLFPALGYRVVSHVLKNGKQLIGEADVVELMLSGIANADERIKPLGAVA